jgi:hypothetical protein
MTFDEALVRLLNGAVMVREAWHGNGLYVKVGLIPSFGEHISSLCIRAYNNRIPGGSWVHTPEDLTATDWVQISEEPLT